MRLQRQSLAALATLDRCPHVPVDVVACLLGLHSRAATYQLLARLRYAGLAQVQPVEVGHVLGGRRIGLWSITHVGRQHLQQRHDGTPHRIGNAMPIYGLSSRHRAYSRATDFPLLVSSYRLLARLMAEQVASGPVEVLAWEFRWRRRAEDKLGGRSVRVELPAAATLVPRSGGPGRTVLLLPDLGTAPVTRYRGLVRRLLLLRAAASDSRLTEPLLAIGTPDPDGHGGRAVRWTSMLAHVARREGQAALCSRVLSWGQCPAAGWREQPVGLQTTSVQQMLDLVGRHPCLSRRQLAGLLGTSPRRVASMCDELVARGWLRPIPSTDIPLVAQAKSLASNSVRRSANRTDMTDRFGAENNGRTVWRPDTPLLLTRTQAAQLCQVSEEIIDQWSYEPGFPVIRRYGGHFVRIHRAALERWIEAFALDANGILRH